MSGSEVLPTNISVERLTRAELEHRFNVEIPQEGWTFSPNTRFEDLIPPTPDPHKQYWLVSMDGLWRITGGFFSAEAIRQMPPIHHLFVYFDAETGFSEGMITRP